MAFVMVIFLVLFTPAALLLVPAWLVWAYVRAAADLIAERHGAKGWV